MDKIINLSKKYNLFVIEDAAEMLGQTYKGLPCGSFGHISTMSFYPNKQITTGEGGMCLVNDFKLAERCKSLRNLCFQKERRFVHEELGWNYRMTNLQAAVGLAQIEKLNYHVDIKRGIGNKYLTLLKDLKLLDLPLKTTDYADNIFWVFGLVIKENSLMDAQFAMKKLTEQGIGVRPSFIVFINSQYSRKWDYSKIMNFQLLNFCLRKDFTFQVA